MGCVLRICGYADGRVNQRPNEVGIGRERTDVGFFARNGRRGMDATRSLGVGHRQGPVVEDAGGQDGVGAVVGAL